ncbi:Golgi-associated olfactory signaling regulator [Varanus komodoensis]|nr:Golgi-associated olfactory signaling regulator [Varanus komodoensis]
MLPREVRLLCSVFLLSCLFAFHETKSPGSCVCLNMNPGHLLVWPLLLLHTSYAIANPAHISTPVPSSAPPSPTSWSSTPPASSESTHDPELLLDPASNTTAPPEPSLPQENQTQSSASTAQTQKPPPQEAVPFKRPGAEAEELGRRQQWEPAAGGVAILVIKPKAEGQLEVREPRGGAGHAMGLFLGVCGLLLCLFIGVYCTYSRGSKKEPFSHHRLYEDGFDDPALFLDSPKDYDWFLYETEGYVYPKPSQTHPKPIQTLSIPALKQPPPALEISPEKLATPKAALDSKQPQTNAVKLESLSPANLHTGNFI